MVRSIESVLNRQDAAYLSGVSFAAVRFEPALHQDEDFLRHGIAMPSSVARATTRRRAEFLAGRLCAREAIEALTGRAEAPATGISRAPHWPADTVGSISHSNSWAAALVGLRRDFLGLGLDLEAPLAASQAHGLLGEVLTPREVARLMSRYDEHIGFVVTLTFSLKESLFKALHPIVGQPFYFHDAELLSWKESGSARMLLLRDLTENWHAGREITACFGHLEGLLLTIVPVRH